MTIIDLLDRPIAFHPALVRLGIGVTGALMLGQAIYWTKRTSDQDGWFWKTSTEWEEETGLTRREQDGARARLREAGFIEERKHGIPARLYYRVNLDKLGAALDMHQTAKQDAPDGVCTKPPNSMHQTAKQYAPNRQYISKTTHRLPIDYGISNTPENPKTPDVDKKPKALPDWIPPVEWQAFVDYRKAIKAPLTDHAVGVAISKLSALRDQGEDLAAVLNQTILSGRWTGVFPVKQDTGPNHAHSGYQKDGRSDYRKQYQEKLDAIYGKTDRAGSGDDDAIDGESRRAA